MLRDIGGDMFTNVTYTTIDMARWDEAFKGIEAVKGRLKGMPGFERAYWLAPVDGHGLMISVWADEASARAGTMPPGFSPAPGVTVDRVETRELIAQT